LKELEAPGSRQELGPKTGLLHVGTQHPARKAVAFWLVLGSRGAAAQGGPSQAAKLCQWLAVAVPVAAEAVRWTGRRGHFSLFLQPSIQQHSLIRRCFILEIHNALVISGRHNGWFFFCELAGTFTQCTNVIPKLHPRH
jgi:hypothetical protein